MEKLSRTSRSKKRGPLEELYSSRTSRPRRDARSVHDRTCAGSSGSFSRLVARPSVRTRRPRPPPLDARLAPRRSRDPGGAPNRRVEVRDASERAEAVRRCQLRGDLRQARAGSRPLQGAYRAYRNPTLRWFVFRPRWPSHRRRAPSLLRRARRSSSRLTTVGHRDFVFSKAPRRDLVPDPPDSPDSPFPAHPFHREESCAPTPPPSSPAARTSSSTTPAKRPIPRIARNSCGRCAPACDVSGFSLVPTWGV